MVCSLLFSVADRDPARKTESLELLQRLTRPFQMRRDLPRFAFNLDCLGAYRGPGALGGEDVLFFLLGAL